MTMPRSYRNAFVAALAFHFAIALLLLSEVLHERPALTMTVQNDSTESQPSAVAHEEQTIKAVSVDNQEVMEAVNRLKNERLRAAQAETKKQNALAEQAALARRQRVEEQQRVNQLKKEAEKLAIAHEKQLAEEKLHLKQLAKQKEAEEKHLAEMKMQQKEMEKQHQKEAEKLAVLKEQKAAEAASVQKEQEAKAKALLAQKQQAAAQQAALDAARNAHIAGEVDKYKALIIGAISRQWILPENANHSLSSQFRIRLAPNGVVLEVNLTRSSGDPILDRSAQSAIFKASPLPVPSDPGTFNLFRDISLTVRPENVRG